MASRAAALHVPCALYGMRNSWTESRDVTAVLRAHATQPGAWPLTVNNASMRCDPAMGKGKALFVRFCDGATALVREGDALRLDEVQHAPARCACAPCVTVPPLAEIDAWCNKCFYLCGEPATQPATTLRTLVCTVQGGGATTHVAAHDETQCYCVPPSDHLYAAYAEWARDGAERVLSRDEFTEHVLLVACLRLVWRLRRSRESWCTPATPVCVTLDPAYAPACDDAGLTTVVLSGGRAVMLGADDVARVLDALLHFAWDVPTCLARVGRPVTTLPLATPPTAPHASSPDDLAVCTAYFSPVGFKRPLDNLARAVRSWAGAGVPVYVMELVYDGREPEVDALGLPATVYTVRARSKLFHKENLWNLLERRVPPCFTKLVFLDADLLFDAPDWPRVMARALDAADVMHPYTVVTRLQRDEGAPPEGTSTSAVAGWATHHPPRVLDAGYVPGYGFAVRREWLHAMGGFMEWAVMGSGDRLHMGALLGCATPRYLSGPLTMQQYAYGDMRRFLRGLQRVCTRPVACAPLHVRHLYHGSWANRRYFDRHRLTQHLTGDDFTRNADGCIEFKDTATWNAVTEAYFSSREEDT